MALPKKPPSYLPSALGPLPITLHSEVIHGETQCWGLTEFNDRSIKLVRGMSPATLWQTFWHEAMHVVMQDSGLTKVVDDLTEEALCNAVGTFLTAAMAQGYLTVAIR